MAERSVFMKRSNGVCQILEKKRLEYCKNREKPENL